MDGAVYVDILMSYLALRMKRVLRTQQEVMEMSKRTGCFRAWRAGWLTLGMLTESRVGGDHCFTMQRDNVVDGPGLCVCHV